MAKCGTGSSSHGQKWALQKAATFLVLHGQPRNQKFQACRDIQANQCRSVQAVACCSWDLIPYSPIRISFAFPVQTVLLQSTIISRQQNGLQRASVVRRASSSTQEQAGEAALLNRRYVVSIAGSEDQERFGISIL